MTATHETLARPASPGNAAASRAGRAAGRRPGQVANCGLVLGAAGLAGAALLAASVPMPAQQVI